jgi:lysyl-tRNA synthetase class 2
VLWKYCRKQIAGPGFLVNVPVFMEPLAKRLPENPDKVQRFQVLLAGV